MKIGLIGMGRMGYNLGLNMVEKGHEVIVYNRTYEKAENFARKSGSATAAETIDEMVSLLPGPRVIWMMVPAGEAVDQIVAKIMPLLAEEDILIDGGNSFYKDSQKRAAKLSKDGIHLLDIGTSGGIEGARNGACMMVGGSRPAYERVQRLLADICVKDGCDYMGPSGAGHFVKMIHNGIEYGIMQAIGEGFEVLDRSQFSLNYESIAKVWAHGSVIRGWLMELTREAFAKDPGLESSPGVVGQSGEGLWTLQTALEEGVPIPAIQAAVNTRFRSNQSKETFSQKVIQAMRHQFGGHDTKTRLE
ncbi:MAG: phosphogluconate dehydrogenase (NAD(+)-dependent, decarboxylating) [Nanoarchaeota archaeon]